MSNDEMTLLKRNGLELPLRTYPIRFAVKRRGGFTSNSWGVRVERKGDAYIYCRDSMKDQKVSLHASGKQHISFNENAASREVLYGRSLHESVAGTATFSEGSLDLSPSISFLGPQPERRAEEEPRNLGQERCLDTRS